MTTTEPDAATDVLTDLPAPIRAAFETKGYTTVTPVQAAVLEIDPRERDLRITSSTGSGKTIAIGLALFGTLEARVAARGPKRPASAPREAGGVLAKPAVMIVAPTRELARQVEEELGWLYAKVGVGIAVVTGGSSYRDEYRALARAPEIVVGTPGRLRDHLDKGALSAESVEVIVLDEADHMLDLGFRDEIDAIVACAPETRRLHLVSATFANEVLRLADRLQRNVLHIEGTPLGSANTDIEHRVYMVRDDERFAVLVNLLLEQGERRCLVFARTRAAVAELWELLRDHGFRVGMLSGEMDQEERLRALAGFKKGATTVLVATDVAARGIDVADLALVVHVEPPKVAEEYTHRSGRTGRAGRGGTSAILVSPREWRSAERVLMRANVRFAFHRPPARREIDAMVDERVLDDLQRDDVAPSPRLTALATTLLTSIDGATLIARILERSRWALGPEAFDVTPVPSPHDRQRQQDRARPGPRDGRFDDRRNDRRFDDRRDDGRRHDARRPDENFDDRRGPRRGPNDGPPPNDRGFEPRSPRTEAPPRPSGEQRDDVHSYAQTDVRVDREVVPFFVTWGAKHGCDPRRLLAIACRRGRIERQDIGAIRVQPGFSIIEVAAPRAIEFESNAREPDPRDPRVTFQRFDPFRKPKRPQRDDGPPAREGAPPREHGKRPPPRGAGDDLPRRRGPQRPS